MNTVNYDDIIPQLDYFVFRSCTDTWKMSETQIDFIDITYILDGKATYFVNQVPYSVEKGDLICITKGSVRRAEINSEFPMSCYAANLLLYDIHGKEKSLPFPVISKIGTRDDIISLYQNINIMSTQRTPGYAIKIRADMLTLLYRYLNILYYKDTYEYYDPRLKKAIRYIYDNYHTNIEVNDLASVVGLSSSYFGLLFKKSTGISVKEFINRVKINYAENLLAEGQLSVAQASLKCGFEDPFYFSKVFKEQKGYSPSKVVLNDYRK